MSMDTATINDVRWTYSEQGSGPALVLLHGFPLDHRVWAGQVAGLCDQYRVIAPDFPGFGQSQHPGGGNVSSFTMKSLAADLHDFLDHLRALPCVLGGLSMGGYVALAFSREYPADLAGLILADTRAQGDTAEGRDGREKMAAIARKDGNRPIVEMMLPRMTAPDASRDSVQVVKHLREIMRDCPAETIALACEAMSQRDDQSTALASIPVPTLILVGEEDQITPPALAEFMQTQIPRATLAVIPSAGHMAPLEQPDSVTQALLAFLPQCCTP